MGAASQVSALVVLLGSGPIKTIEFDDFMRFTATYSKTQMRGRQWPSYRFILSVLEGASMPEAIVVRHRCHNGLCINPEHLQFETQADNKRDDVARWANGMDHDYL
jgi:hypothetical protein